MTAETQKSLACLHAFFKIGFRWFFFYQRKFVFSFQMLEEQQVKFHMNNSVTEIQGANGKVSIIVFSSNSKEVRWTFSINCAASGIKGRVTPAKIRILTQLIWEHFLWGQTKTVAKIGVAVSRLLWISNIRVSLICRWRQWCWRVGQSWKLT